MDSPRSHPYAFYKVKVTGIEPAPPAWIANVPPQHFTLKKMFETISAKLVIAVLYPVGVIPLEFTRLT
jgi:hypothetical protein